MFGVVLPVPPGATETERLNADACAQSMTDATQHALMVAVSRMPPAERACLAARLYANCARGTVTTYERFRAEGAYFDAALMAQMKRSMTTAEAFEAKACNDALRQRTEPTAKTITEAWSKAWNE